MSNTIQEVRTLLENKRPDSYVPFKPFLSGGTDKKQTGETIASTEQISPPDTLEAGLNTSVDEPAPVYVPFKPFTLNSGLAEEPAEGPAEELAPEPAAAPAEEPAPEPAEAPAEELAPEPAAEPEQELAPEPAEAPAEELAPEPAADAASEKEAAPEEAEEKPGLGRRIVAFVGTLLLIASIITILSPLWIKYYDRYNPFNTVQEKPVLPVIDVTDANNVEFDVPLPVGAKGVLEIPALALKADVSYGIDSATLEQGLGFYPQSNIPAKGNVSIAGHRNMAGSPFLNLDKLIKGDTITLAYEESLYTYAVDSVFITNDRDWSVIDPTPEPALTLTTCDPVIRPLDGKYDRLIVRAYLKSTTRQ